MTDTHEPRPGDIGLVAMPGAGGKLIRFGQWLAGDGWSKIQHAFVVVGPEGYNGETKIVEAMPGGARMVSLSYRYGDPQKITYLRCPPQYGEAVAQAAISFLDVPYSALDYGAIALHRFRIPAPKLRRYIADSKHMICSQLADAAAMYGGWHIFADGRWPGYVTPNDLWKVFALQERAGHPIERAKVTR